MRYTYLILKSVHIFGVIILLGNLIVTAWWKLMANRIKNPCIIAFAQRQVTLTDFVFTAPCAFLANLAGDFMTYGSIPKSWNDQWLTCGHSLFFALGIIWITL